MVSERTKKMEAAALTNTGVNARRMTQLDKEQHSRSVKVEEEEHMIRARLVRAVLELLVTILIGAIV